MTEDFWTDDATHTKLAAGALYGIQEVEHILSAWVSQYFEPVRDRVQLLDAATDVAPGILVIPAPGHTPGHAAVLISSGRQQLLYVADAVGTLRSWHTRSGRRRSTPTAAQTVRTRRQLPTVPRPIGCLVFPFHVPLPCVGRSVGPERPLRMARRRERVDRAV